jgi:hypothetical protein
MKTEVLNFFIQREFKGPAEIITNTRLTKIINERKNYDK